MATLYKYLGKPGVVGRFGHLSTGDTVELRQVDVDYLAKNPSPDWEPAGKTDTKGVGTILPVRTHIYNLALFRWQYGMHRRLNSIRSRATLLRMYQAMRSIGANLPLSDQELKLTNTLQLIDAIYTEARRLKWDQPGYEPVDASGETVSSEETPEEESGCETEGLIEEAETGETEKPAETPENQPEILPEDHPAQQRAVKRAVKRAIVRKPKQ